MPIKKSIDHKNFEGFAPSPPPKKAKDKIMSSKRLTVTYKKKSKKNKILIIE